MGDQIEDVILPFISNCVCVLLPLVFKVVCLYLQKLCDYVCDLLLEESNVQPVSSPVTVCGDIHGQVRID